jgi:hypothetical protein
MPNNKPVTDSLATLIHEWQMHLERCNALRSLTEEKFLAAMKDQEVAGQIVRALTDIYEAQQVPR